MQASWRPGRPKTALLAWPGIDLACRGGTWDEEAGVQGASAGRPEATPRDRSGPSTPADSPASRRRVLRVPPEPLHDLSSPTKHGGGLPARRVGRPPRRDPCRASILSVWATHASSVRHLTFCGGRSSSRQRWSGATRRFVTPAAASSRGQPFPLHPPWVTSRQSARGAHRNEAWASRAAREQGDLGRLGRSTDAAVRPSPLHRPTLVRGAWCRTDAAVPRSTASWDNRLCALRTPRWAPSAARYTRKQSVDHRAVAVSGTNAHRRPTHGLQTDARHWA